MALTFGGLFERTGLEQETGVIAERWGQDGSSIVNDLTLSVEDETIYTVTAGKKLYVTSIIIQETDGTSSTYDPTFIDGGSGGTPKLKMSAANDETVRADFNVPIEFTIDVYVSSASTGAVTLIGWEE